MHTFSLAAFLKGFSIGISLIVVIGMQNAFVLKQGILKKHVLLTVLICTLCDLLLISIGMIGAGRILATNHALLSVARWGGAIFLLYYSLLSFRSVFKNQALEIPYNKDNGANLKLTIMTALAVSLLNPHAYLDTVVLIGSIGAQLPQTIEQIWFAVGAMLASVVWFFSLGFGARFLGPLFQKPIAWKILDFMVGCIMTTIAIILIINT